MARCVEWGGVPEYSLGPEEKDMTRSGSGKLRVLGSFVLATAIALTFAASPAAGQGTATQAVIGQVTDSSGGVLPGVTVSATSPALQVPSVTAVTNEVGEYRLAPLPIGVYQLTFELQGFGTTRREDVRLTSGFVARVDVVLGINTLSEVVTVSGAAPVVDVTSTSSSTRIPEELVDATPTTRNGMISLMQMAPGARTFVEVGGNNIQENPAARVFGQGGEFWYTLEGIGIVGTGNQWDLQTLEETRVQTMGTDAEFPTRGLQLNAIVKSGGNDYHGGLLLGLANKRFQSSNIDEELNAIGITSGNALKKQFDFGGDLGGYLVRNKLWFYGAFRQRGAESTVLQCFQPDGESCYDMAGQKFGTGKASFQLSPAQRFIGFMYWHGKKEIGKSNELQAWDAREESTGAIRNAKGEWQGVRGDSLVASVQMGGYRFNNIVQANGTEAGRFDIATERLTRENIVAGDDTRNFRLHSTGALTWYKPNAFRGNHEIKTGFDYVYTETGKGLHTPGPNYQLVFDNEVPYQVAFFNAPVQPLNAWKYLGLYVRDTWTMGRRLTLNVGARFANDRVYVPEQCREAAKAPSDVFFPARCFDEVRLNTWNSIAPRARASYDLFGDGSTVIKGGWGRYDRMRQAGDVNRFNPNSIVYNNFFWRDLNGNNDYDAGEVNLDVNGPDFDRSTGSEFADVPPKTIVNTNERQPKLDEYSIALERQLISNFGVRVTALHTHYRDVFRSQNNLRPYDAYNIPVTNQDPGPDGIVGTGDDGGLITYFEYSPALAGAEFEEFMVVNDSGIDPKHTAIELAGVKRLSNRWQLMVSYSATKKDKPNISALNPTGFAAAVGPDGGSLDPNSEINRADKTWEWDFKAMGSYTFPYDILVSSIFDHRSGDAFARQVQFRGGETIRSIVLNVEPIGSQRLPNLNLLSLRFEKAFRVLEAHKLAVQVNLYNALNANTATSVQPRAGSTFLRPRAVLPPRLLELSMAYTF
jgi:hypothetical protein